MIERVSDKHLRSEDKAYELLSTIIHRDFSEIDLSAFIGQLQSLQLSPQLLSGFRKAMLDAAIPIPLAKHTVDLCGTGGDGKHTFNISTLAALTVASLGIAVTKHGNSAFSSACGSSDILQAVGIPLPKNPTEVSTQLSRCNFAFIHAPFFHPLLSKIGKVRRALQTRTVFNILGPTINPARPAYSVYGVSHYPIHRLYRSILSYGQTPYAVIWDFEGYDEITLCGKSLVTTSSEEMILTSQSFGCDRVYGESLDCTQDPHSLFMKIASGNGSAAQTAVVSANAAIALRLVDPKLSLIHCFSECQSALRSGRVVKVIEDLKGSL